MRKTLDEILNSKIQTTINALRVAGDQYQRDAEATAACGTISAQFERQAVEVRDLADALEENWI